MRTVRIRIYEFRELDRPAKNRAFQNYMAHYKKLNGQRRLPSDYEYTQEGQIAELLGVKKRTATAD